MSEGFDYSSTGHGDWAALAAAMRAVKGNVGEIPVGRYAVNDKAPSGRGISAAEYRALAAAGFGVFVFWESSEGWMLGGFPAGVLAAENAHANLLEAGMPERMPIIFACDFDATPAQQAAIEDCLRGCASVIGRERTGLYAGYYPLQRAMQNGTATWFVQTSAWSAGMILPGIHALQYEYNQWVGGTNMDLIRTYQDNYGQASQFLVAPKPETVATVPWDKEAIGIHLLNGVPVNVFRAEVTTKDNPVAVRTTASKSSEVIATLAPHSKAVSRGAFFSGGRMIFLIETEHGIGRAWAAGFVERHYAPRERKKAA